MTHQFSRRLLYIKLAVVVSVAVFVTTFVFMAPSVPRAAASASGPSPSFTGAPGEQNCTACHTTFAPNSGTGSLSISGIPANYRPGQQVPVTVTATQSDGVLFGFEMTAIDNIGRPAGTFSFPAVTPQPLQIVNGFVDNVVRNYIEHTIDGITPTQFGSKTWNMTWTAPARRVGKVGFYAAGNAADSDGTTNGDRIYTTSRAALSGTAISNFDTDGISEIGVFRPSIGAWFSMNSTDGTVQGVTLGQAGDKIAPGDYDGDGKTDRAVFRPSNGTWYILNSGGGSTIVQWGQNGDLPVTGDYDGDLKADIAVYRPSSGVWYVLQSTGSYTATQFGIPGDRTAQGDFDGDAKTDLAVYRPSTGAWYILQSADGFTALQFGLNGDQPVQSDYDGDGRTDVAVYRPSNGVWFLLTSSGGLMGTQFGLATDRVAPADYDGDGKTDVAVFRPSTSVWYIYRSSDYQYTILTFGSNGDIPIASGYLAE